MIRPSLPLRLLLTIVIFSSAASSVKKAEAVNFADDRMMATGDTMTVRISQSVPRHLCRRAIRNTQV